MATTQAPSATQAPSITGVAADVAVTMTAASSHGLLECRTVGDGQRAHPRGAGQSRGCGSRQTVRGRPRRPTTVIDVGVRMARIASA